MDEHIDITKAINHLEEQISSRERMEPISYENFLTRLILNPSKMIRNVFQVFHDMMMSYVSEGVDEYPDDPESIQFVKYDFNRLLVDDVDRPFFADRLFANRLIQHTVSFRRGAQQNKIYIFDGPPGCGKSTFLNNLLKKYEKYANSKEGRRLEILWRLDRKSLGGHAGHETAPLFEKLFRLIENKETDREEFDHTLRAMENDKNRDFVHSDRELTGSHGDYLEIPCPSHDHPILMIPKEFRRDFLDELFENQEFKWNLFTEKEYEWVFMENPCTICSSLYNALLSRLNSVKKVFEMVYARSYRFNRRIGEGVSVFNPGDKPSRQIVLSNSVLQRKVNNTLEDSNLVKYIYSRYAKTNNGIYALMDIKSHNTGRLIELHNIISEGVHKVEDVEENVNSLFFALMNPEDKVNVQDIPSFSDRIEYINIPYVLDLNTEVEIYRNIFGRHIDDHFLPRVLHNFARVIISSRLRVKSEPLNEWIGDANKYNLYCDGNLQLLKMEIYTGHIPEWLTEEDRKRFTAKRRKEIIKEGETEGAHGFSGRDSIKIFNDFYSAYARQDRLINMTTLSSFFTNVHKEFRDKIPGGFMESLNRMYDYTVLQAVKESLYYYNEEQIARDIQNYLFALNFETGSVETCTFTGDKLEISDAFFEPIENHLLGDPTDMTDRSKFREVTQKVYTSKTLTQEIMVEGKPVVDTELYASLHERYIHNLKEKALDPFLENDNFRRAIKDYDTEDFKTYDKRIRDDVTFLMYNLCKKYNYTDKGAKEVCIYVIDNDLAGKYAKS